MAIDRNQGITGILNPELENVRKAVQETPELGDMYSQFFGGSYQPDIEGGTGTAQYYDFSGKLDPYWAQKTIPVVQEPEPVVQDPTTMIPQTGGGEEITGASVVQPAGGEQINVDTPLTQMITTPTGDSMTVKEAFTQPEAYSLPGESDPFLASGAAGGARLPATQATTTLPSGDVFATDDPMLQEKMDYTEKTPAWWESARDKFVQTGQDVGGFFGDLKDKGINVGQIAIGSLMNMVQPGLGLLSRAIPEETSEDVWNKQFAFGGENFQDIVTSDPDLGKRLEGYSKDLIAGTGGNKDPFGRNTVSAFGDYEARLAEDLQYTGDSQFSLDKKAYAQAYFDKKGIGLNPNEAKAFEEKYGISPTGAPVTRDRLIDEGIEAADEEPSPITVAAKENTLQEELEAYRDPIMDMEPAESVDLGNPLNDPRIVPEEWETEGAPWTGYQDPIMERAEQEAREAEQRAAEQARAQREMQEQIAAAEAMEAARQAEIDRQNREAAAAAAAAQRAREQQQRDRDRDSSPSGTGAGAGGGSQQATSGGGFSSGWGGGWGWSKGGIVGLKNAKR